MSMMTTLYTPLNHSLKFQPISLKSLTPIFNIVSYCPKTQHQLFINITKQRDLLTTVPMASSTELNTETETKKPFSVLFVCLGNICRSPAAEGVFSGLVKYKGLDCNFKIDSAGTIGYHEGNQADPRMRAAAKKRGIQITSLSRPIKPSDFRDFDLILAMDRQNKVYTLVEIKDVADHVEDILGALERWRFKETLPADAHKKVRLMCSYCKRHNESEVPDPYYGGAQGFEKVLDLLEDACESLLDSILAENTTT